MLGTVPTTILGKRRVCWVDPAHTVLDIEPCLITGVPHKTALYISKITEREDGAERGDQDKTRKKEEQDRWGPALASVDWIWGTTQGRWGRLKGEEIEW